jgi:transposase
MTYSLDLRKRVLKYLESGGTQKEASSVFDISPKTVTNWAKRNKEDKLSPTVRKNRTRKIGNDLLIKYIEKHSDAYLREIAEKFGVTVQAIFYACKRLRITLKKRQKVIKNGMKKREEFYKKTRKDPQRKPCVYR